MNFRRSTLPIIALVTAAAATSACASARQAAVGPGSGTSSTSAASAGTPAGGGSTPAPAGSAMPATSAMPNTPTSPTSTAKTAATTAPAPAAPHSSARPGDPDAASDSYAWTHPCDPGQITTRVTENAPGSHDGVRLVTVTNTGPKACGLSYYPVVVISDSTSMGSTSHPTRYVQPRPPGGLGGQPYVPVYAGRSQYAALSLNPGHAADASRSYDEIDIQPADFMPHAATVNFSAKDTPDKADPAVHDPIVTLYYPTAAEAVGMLRKG